MREAISLGAVRLGWIGLYGSTPTAENLSRLGGQRRGGPGTVAVPETRTGTGMVGGGGGLHRNASFDLCRGPDLQLPAVCTSTPPLSLKLCLECRY